MSDTQEPQPSSNDQPTETASPSGQITGASRKSADPLLRGAMAQRIGRYHIRRVIGSGGMGTVYEAIQERPHRSVALKVMKRGVVSKAARRRFEYESQVLARLRHPGIAQVYEAGIHDDTSGPLPYFAMEYIPNAKSITEYAKQRKLSTRRRLAIFIQACEAVYHGHQKGIIHRDLKPANILVDAHGQVKIIDFGVARSTDSDMAITTQQTAVGELIGTLKYMSPEQCEGDPHDIDTRSDVYAIGVVLYELLCGRLPYDLDQTPVYEVPRVIREVAVRHLSAVDKTLRGDVETIVEKALEKDRDRRYRSALALADDIKRYLNNEPILARPPSLLYALKKFVRRRRGPLAAAAGLVLALGVAAYFQSKAKQADSARALADARGAATVRAIRAFSSEALGTLVGGRAKLITDWNSVIELAPDFALPYAFRAKLSMLDQSYDAALRDCERALELDSTNSLALRTMGFLRLRRRDFAGALDAFDRGIKALGHSYLAADYHNRAGLYRMFGRYEPALADHDRAVALAPRVGHVYQGRGLTKRFAGDLDGAIEDLALAASADLRPQPVQCNQWIWEIRMLRGHPGDREAADMALAAAWKAATSPFEAKLVDVCAGRATSDEVLADVATDSQRCLALYYLGARALVQGRRDGATRFFQLCLDTDQGIENEYGLSQWHLKHLAGDKASHAQP